MAQRHHVVMFSSGVGSWSAARRVAAENGTDNLVLLFTDVKGGKANSPNAGEDKDNYRFLRQAAANIGGKLVIINEGRDIWEVYNDEHMMGNSRIAPCSKRLKQIPARKWVDANCDPTITTIYVGIDWTEAYRLDGARKGWDPWWVEAPLIDPPTYFRHKALVELKEIGIRPPRLYELGFQHANCGGFCCRMGKTQAAHLLKVFPKRYAYHEAREQRFRARFGKDVSFMKEQRDRIVYPITMKSLRERIEKENAIVDELDWGGCGCFFDE